MNIFLSLQACETGLDHLDALIGKKINLEDPVELQNHIAELSAVQGYSAKIMGSCEYIKLSTNTPYNRALFTLSERMNTGLGKSLLAYQSILSKIKAELSTLNFHK